MSILGIALCSGLLPKLGQERGNVNGFRDWLQAGNYAPLKPGSAQEIVLDRVRYSEFVGYANYDYERFALSSKETALSFDLEWNKYGSAAWPLIKVYYSAFYSAHSIMRSRGCGYTTLGVQQVKLLNATVKAYHPKADDLVGGSYIYKVAPSQTVSGEASVLLYPSPKGTGVHEGFWISFAKFLSDEAASAVTSSLPDASDFLLEAMSLQDALISGSHSGGVWFSGVRNEINYQHLHETWFPLRKGSESMRSFSTLPTLNTAHLSISKKKLPILAFVNLSLFVASVGIQVGDFVAARSDKGGAFGQKWRRLSSAYATK